MSRGARGNRPATVAEFLAGLDHSLAPVVRAVCSTIVSASPVIGEGIKWNAPSYFVGRDAWFATVNIHVRGKAPPTVLVVLHRGAKALPGKVAVTDRDGLIEWLGPDRGVLRLTSVGEARRRRGALQAIVREWIGQVSADS